MYITNKTRVKDLPQGIRDRDLLKELKASKNSRAIKALQDLILSGKILNRLKNGREIKLKN